MLLASCSYEEAKKYRNKLVLVSEEEVKKPEEVILNICTDSMEDIEEIKKNGLGVAKCLTTKVNPGEIPEKLWGNVFHEVPLEEYNGVCESKGVVCLVRLPNGFCDMRKLDKISSMVSKYEDVEHKVRFIGGNLLEIPGIGIGRYDKGKEKLSSVFNGVYDIFREVSLSDIKVQEIMSKVRSVSKTGSKQKSTSSTSNSKTKKKEAFAKFFGGSEGGF